MDPRTGDDPRAGELAAGRRQRPRRRARLRAPEPRRRRRPTSPARRSRRSPSPARSQDGMVTPTTPFDVAAADPGRRPHDPRRRATTARDAHRRRRSSRSPRNVGAVKIGLRLGRDALRPVGAHASASASPTGVDLPGEEPGIVPAAQGLLGLLDGQPADRPGPGGHADADGGRLRGDRQRRHPAPAAHHRARSAASRPRAARARGSSRRRPRRAAHDARGRARPGRHRASEAAIPGYELAGKTGTAEKPDPVNGGYSETKYVASFIGFAPGRRPAAAGRGDGRRAAGRRSTAAPVAAPAFQKIVELRAAVPRASRPG